MPYPTDWEAGFSAGYTAGLRAGAGDIHHSGKPPTFSDKLKFETGRKSKRKKSKKVRILDEMSKKAWDKYKKGSGKKTYVQIRAQVSRSVTYKKRVKNL